MNYTLNTIYNPTEICQVSKACFLETVNHINKQIWEKNLNFIIGTIIFYILLILERRIFNKIKNEKFKYIYNIIISIVESLMLVWALTIAYTILFGNPWLNY